MTKQPPKKKKISKRLQRRIRALINKLSDDFGLSKTKEAVPRFEKDYATFLEAKEDDKEPYFEHRRSS